MNVDITKREEIDALLSQLTENTEAKWGVMQPQNMVEHLIATLQISYGKIRVAQRTTEQEAALAKEGFIYTDVEMPKGLKSSLLGETVAPFEHPSLTEAKWQLSKELGDFEQFYAGHPDATFIHPRLGRLKYKEWIILHNKHFTHHFKQFGLI